MADLIDRLTFDERITGRPKIASHQFAAYLGLYALGLVTQGEIDATWDLQGDEQTQAVLVATAIDNAVGAEAKHLQVDRFDFVAMLLDYDDPRYVTGETIDKAKVRSDAGF